MKRRTNNAEADSTERRLFKDDFFIPFDGELFNDIKDGKLTPTEFCVYSMLLRQADFDTGIWTGSASYICIGWGRQLNQRTVQHRLKQLAEKGLIKSFHRRGQRSDYAVAIHNYRVRYGKWKGYKLDASATTDSRHPVYRPDCEPTTISERTDSESSAQPQRKHSESTANPIARNTPEHPDALDVPEDNRTTKLPTTSTAVEPPLIVGRLEPDADVVVGIGSDKLNGQGQLLESEQRGVDRGRFMGAVRRIWRRTQESSIQLQTTYAHIEAAIMAAEKIGEEVFLAAWSYWLNAREEELWLAKPEARRGIELRAWPLHYFVSAGVLDELVDIVRPFAGLAEDETLKFLVWAQELTTTPITIRPENLAILRAFIDRYCVWGGEGSLSDEYKGQPMDVFVQEVVVPFRAKLGLKIKENMERITAQEREASEAGTQTDRDCQRALGVN
jgi:hypothetical protein